MPSSSPQAIQRTVPARPNFLTIYNPALGNTDETEQEQIIVWADREQERRQSRPRSRDARPLSHEEPAGSGATDGPSSGTENGLPKSDQKLIDERLRQIGLARGMVEFAKTFSTDKPVNIIETSRSRLILHELEPSWWVLASIDLTKLPAASNPSSSSSAARVTATQDDPDGAYEYSAREVAPGSLLLAHITRAHRIFMIHHAPTLNELYYKFGRPAFSLLLGRFWQNFFDQWDVLLHGNPAIDVYGLCTKLAGGGELGVGVGEEEWGSGEREVLEGFIERTEGLLDLVVGRYGDGPQKRRKANWNIDAWDTASPSGTEVETWLGLEENPAPSDGIIFTGAGTLSRPGLATISQWMEAIFMHGEAAYGVGENPTASAGQRKRRQRRKPAGNQDPENAAQRSSQALETSSDRQGPSAAHDMHTRLQSPRGKAKVDLRRQTLQKSVAPPGIPPPLVGAVEKSLDEAIAKATQRSKSRSPKSSPKEEKSQAEAMGGNRESSSTSPNSTSRGGGFFDSENMMKMLKFGYGTSWTLNPDGFKESSIDGNDARENDVAKNTVQDPKPHLQQNSDTRQESPPAFPERPQLVRKVSKPAEERLQEIDPTPEASDEEGTHKGFVQHLEQSVGRFLIGLSGDLENTEFEDKDQDPFTSSPDRKPARIYHRTLTMEVSQKYVQNSTARAGRTFSSASQVSAGSMASDVNAAMPKTSAAASVDGPAETTTQHRKMQVAVYVHQPFIFVFLFELHTANLTMPQFYRSIHHQLGPLQGILLKRTDPEHMKQRVQHLVHEKTAGKFPGHTDTHQVEGVIYDLIYDPVKLTVRTSIPNIPVPVQQSVDSGTDAKTGTVSGAWYTLGIPIGSSSPTSSSAASPARGTEMRTSTDLNQWPRLDALNVHMQILNSYTSTHPVGRVLDEVERTSKTQRGFWVLWMRIPISSNESSSSSRPEHETKLAKEAFLIRKSATDVLSPTKHASGGGKWLLREQGRAASGTHSGSASSAGDVTSVRGVGEGVGIDARRWVEGLLGLGS